jgi:hypothetical protein
MRENRRVAAAIVLLLVCSSASFWAIGSAPWSRILECEATVPVDFGYGDTAGAAEADCEARKSGTNVPDQCQARCEDECTAQSFLEAFCGPALPMSVPPPNFIAPVLCRCEECPVPAPETLLHADGELRK